MKVCLIAAALPPRIDGIGDFSANLAAQLALTPKIERVEILTGEERPAPIPNVSVRTVFSPTRRQSVLGIGKALWESRPDWVVLQYNAFSYGRRGLNLHLPLVLRAARRSIPHLRLAVMVHEPFMPAESLKMAIMTTWQRWQLWMLGRAADVVFFSIDPWVRRFSPWFKDKLVAHLPVSSNIPQVPLERAAARQRLNIDRQTVVMGLFGTARSPRMLEWVKEGIAAAGRDGQDVLLHYIGPHREIVQAAMPAVKLVADGALSAEEVSKRLAAVDIYLSPFIDGASTRRTSMMSGLQHGLAMVTTDGEWTDSMLKPWKDRAFLMVHADRPGDFCSAVRLLSQDVARRASLGAGAKSLFESEFTWERIAQRMLQTLG